MGVVVWVFIVIGTSWKPKKFSPTLTTNTTFDLFLEQDRVTLDR